MRLATEALGWASAAILLATMVRQVYTQWRTHSAAGVSRWLFAGQLVASLGFLVYSVLVENAVFAITNAFLAAAAVAGQSVDRANRRRSGAPDHGAP